MTQCDVRFCRKPRILKHLPLNAGLCREHWEQHCDGKKLEIAQ